MKRILIAVMLLMMLCSCGTTTESEQSTDAPEQNVETITKPDKDLDEIIADVDAILNENIGDYILATEYNTDIDKYMVLMTIDGIDDIYGTSDFYEVCYMLDGMSETICDDIGLENVIILASDNDVSVCLYATDCGENITDILS